MIARQPDITLLNYFGVHPVQLIIIVLRMKTGVFSRRGLVMA